MILVEVSNSLVYSILIFYCFLVFGLGFGFDFFMYPEQFWRISLEFLTYLLQRSQHVDFDEVFSFASVCFSDCLWVSKLSRLIFQMQIPQFFFKQLSVSWGL